MTREEYTNPAIRRFEETQGWIDIDYIINGKTQRVIIFNPKSDRGCIGVSVERGWKITEDIIFPSQFERCLRGRA